LSQLRPIRIAAALALAVAGLAVGPALSASATNTPGINPNPNSACSAGWYYSPTGRGADTFAKVGSTHSDYNGTPSNASVTFTATTSGTVTTSVSGGTNVGVSAKVASISSTYGISASTSLAVTVGNSITITVPPMHSGNGDYGAWRAYVTGIERYYAASCAVTQSHSTTVYSPYKKGWNTWIS